MTLHKLISNIHVYIQYWFCNNTQCITTMDLPEKTFFPQKHGHLEDIVIFVSRYCIYSVWYCIYTPTKNKNRF